MRPHEKWSADRRQVSAVGVVDGKPSIGCVRCARLVQPGATHLQRPYAVTLGGAYAAVPARCCFGRKNVIATFDGGLWGLVRLPGTGCARREN